MNPYPEVVSGPEAVKLKPRGLTTLVPARMVKFAVVGGIGVLVNLLVLAIVQQVSGSRAGWTSLIANFVATLHNYIVNNVWTFRDCQKRGSNWIKGALLYFAVATIGILVTTGCYILFTSHLAHHLLRQAIGSVPAWFALLSQLAAIVVGTALNYFLNKTFTWRIDTQPVE